MDEQLETARENFESYTWAPDIYDKFLKMLYEKDVLNREYYDS